MRKGAGEDFHRQRRAQIIEAAKESFAQSGFHGATMAELSQQSGLSAGQLYRYFDSKDALIDAVVRQVAGQWYRLLAEKLLALTDYSAILFPQSPFWSDWPARERVLLLETFSEASRSATLQSILRQEEQDLIDALVNHDAPPTSLQDESRRRAAIELLLTLINGAVCRTFHEEDIDSAITAVVTRFLSAAVRA
ncbi:Transcriptional regulator TetR family [Candidatus Sodalis pierantonius str. SOPE]|uniref:Transcriptional regulator TetR family n=1 Tax=Candidatus Sodalis pierantonii str. SOPE TaxID=2342 RepID=W0HJX1_9GAMM|nr:TetR/AcrR family transcriptional regulator [Candidatus Sodalis pierantonius]AHF74094.1 Transcriptional regulator TetR family [Candidatus Sodalis pierantonius str. SOPE]